MRPLLLSVAGLGLLAVAAGATWWQGGPVAEPAPELASTVQETPDAEHEVLTPDGEPAMVEIIGERHVAAPGDNRVALNNAPGLVPVPPAETVAALRESMKNGDPRTPPLARSEDLREMPSAAELADPGLYQQYEQRQNQKVYASFVTAANQKITELEAQIARAEASGLPPEQLEEGRQKLEGLRGQRDEILQTHPDVAAEIQSGAVGDGQE